MTFHATPCSTRLREAFSRIGAEIITRTSQKVEPVSATRLQRSLILLASLSIGAGCTPTTYSILRDPPDYVDHVLEDVTAIVEGMARAHSREREVYRDPGIRSSRQPN